MFLIYPKKKTHLGLSPVPRQIERGRGHAPALQLAVTVSPPFTLAGAFIAALAQRETERTETHHRNYKSPSPFTLADR